MIVLDFETRSEVDLRNTGASVYARDKTTEILCLAYTLDFGETVQLWKKGDPPPADLCEAAQRGEEFHAHNAMFERLIWKHVCCDRMGWPDVSFHQWRCTLAACSRLALPRSLEAAGQALGLPIEKDTEGRRIMLKLAKPRKPTKFNKAKWHESPEDYQKLYDYCCTDVLAECEIIKAIEDLTPEQLEVWQLDQRINLRGMPVDPDAMEAAQAVVERRKADYGKELEVITGGAVTAPSDAGGIRKWLNQNGVQTTTVAASWITATLKKDLMPDVRRVLEIRQAAGKSSTSKLQKMEHFRDSDNRLRGGFRYHGAATGRWAGMGFQPHNFPSRGALGKGMDETFFPMLKDLYDGIITRADFELFWGDTVNAISGALRGMFCAPDGKEFRVCDFSGIEARVLAWLAGEDDLLKTFPLEGIDGDVYISMAADIYRVPREKVTKTQRALGKIAVLGCGYSMGGPKFADSVFNFTGKSILDFFPDEDSWPETNAMVEQWDKSGYDLELIKSLEPRKQKKYFENAWKEGFFLWAKIAVKEKWAEEDNPVQYYIRKWQAENVGRTVVKQYRTSNPAIKSLWYDLAEACMDSISKPGRRIYCGHVSVVSDDEWMKIQLPSGRELHYRHPRLVEVDAPWDKEKPKKERKRIPQIQFETMISAINKWAKDRTYGGKLVENITQAVAADLLMEAMLRVEKAGYTIIATIHDEIVSEDLHGFGSLEEFERLMKVVPEWAAGCPIDVEGFAGKRYRK